MTLVNSKEEIDKIRPYKEHYNLTVYPKNYPAFVEFVSHAMELLEIPENLDIKSFIAGVCSKPEIYGEGSIFTKK